MQINIFFALFLYYQGSMDKKGILNSALLKNLFDSKINKWVVVSSIALFLWIYLYFSNNRQLIIFPGRNDSKYEFYTDIANDGNSTIISHVISDSAISIDFQLNGGFITPGKI